MPISGAVMGISREIPPNAKLIHFTRTDGDPSKRPTNVNSTPDSTGHVNYYRQFGIDEVVSIAWRHRIGQEIAKQLNYPGDPEEHYLSGFPEHYAFFDHTKGPVHGPRHDPYLFGSSRVGKFRSPPEFIPHALWLLTDETLNPANCKCKYCSKTKSQREVNDIVGITTSGAHTGRANVVRRIKPVPKLIHPTQMVAKDRNSDLRRRQRYRVGELVWCHIDSPIRCSDEPAVSIDFWPGIIQEIRLKSTVKPHLPGERYNITQSDLFKLKLLAVTQSPVLDTHNILPYQGYLPPEGLLEYIKSCPRPTRSQIDHIPSFTPYLVEGNRERLSVDAIPAFTYALQMSAHISRYYTPTDSWTFTPESQSAPSEEHIIRSETRYQGLWWGPERIWMDELVRIKSGHLQLMAHGAEIYPGTAEALKRGLLLHLRAIFIDEDLVPRLGGHSGQMEKKRLCRCAGQLYEVADPDWETDPRNAHVVEHAKTIAVSSSGSSAGPTSSQSAPLSYPAKPISRELYPLPPAPEGYIFRPLLPLDHELVLDISSLSGRYYPDILLEKSLLRLDDNVAPPNGGEVGFIAALSGLTPGFYNAVECTTWQKSRLEMVRLSLQFARQEMATFWNEDFSQPKTPPRPHGYAMEID